MVIKLACFPYKQNGLDVVYLWPVEVGEKHWGPRRNSWSKGNPFIMKKLMTKYKTRVWWLVVWPLPNKFVAVLERWETTLNWRVICITTRKQCPKWLKIDQKKLTVICHFGQITVHSDILCQFFVTLDNFLSIFYHLSRLDLDMFMSIRTLFPYSAWVHTSNSTPK